MDGSLTFVQTYLLVVVGIVLSIVLPILRAKLPKPPAGAMAFRDVTQTYVVVGIFSLLTALLVVAATDVLADWRAAVIAGYAWDSTLQKLASHPG